ncbi:RNA polymerase sigma factor [Kribbella solani]|uniref:RNA polymerase sigma-70 factor (ECF subfamily) n=1 Tax=Kribbella solani TaxID=236067 RepID=A0A841DE05_9ACTN|nr:RNA polymerase sigma factor [Kribbella solani]MBB5977304.1 RNA polymerase sigma-70 factor (ECF subfamily) [Kribbella solani]
MNQAPSPTTDHPPPESSPPPSSDRELLSGSVADFGRLFDRYAAQLHRYCSRRIGPDLADDVVAETFLIAYERRCSFDPSRSSGLPWLYGIATNVLHRHRKAEARAHRILTYQGDSADIVAETATERTDAAARIRTIARVLGALPRRHRDVIFLAAAGLEYAEIAAALAIPVGTVRSRLHRARARLRWALDHSDVPTIVRSGHAEAS